MAKTIVGFFDSLADARSAMDELLTEGYERSDISIVAANTAPAADTRDDNPDDGTDAVEGAGVGAATGAVVGGAAGLLASLAGLTIPVIGPVLAAGPLFATIVGAGTGALTGGLIGLLVNAGVPEEHARLYEEGVRRGGTLLTVRAEDALAERAAIIMNRHNAIDINRRAEEWKTSQQAGPSYLGTAHTSEAAAGVNSGASSPTPPTYASNQTPDRSGLEGTNASTNITAGSMAGAHLGEQDMNRKDDQCDTNNVQRTTAASQQNLQQTSNQQIRSAGEKDKDQISMPVVEEELRVGKREVETGGVRIESKVEEKPVQEQVHLHEEKINVERRPTNRPASHADLRNQPGESFEVTETREEPVVQKQARVVEEVVVSKEARDRVETVNDTVRRKDVEVHQTGGSHKGYEAFDDDFRSNFQSTYGSSGGTYDQYAPAYQYGYNLRSNQRYANKDWSAIESDVRTDWERSNPNSSWERMKDAVRYGWNKMTSSTR